MRTRQLSINIGAYADGTWHVTLTEAVYEQGRMVSQSVSADRWRSDQAVIDTAARALHHAMDMERARVELEHRQASERRQKARSRPPGS